MQKVSFCSGLFNRAWQLEKTLDHNLALLEGTPHEWVITNLSSTDNPRLPKHPNLRVLDVPNPSQKFNLPLSYNTSFLASAGEVIMSFDVDNYLSTSLIEHLSSLRAEHYYWGVDKDKHNPRGSHGRIAAHRTAWEKIGWYQLHEPGYAFCDNLALDRLKILGLTEQPHTVELEDPVWNGITDAPANYGTSSFEELFNLSRQAYAEAPFYFPPLGRLSAGDKHLVVHKNDPVSNVEFSFTVTNNLEDGEAELLAFASSRGLSLKVSLKPGAIRAASRNGGIVEIPLLSGIRTRVSFNLDMGKLKIQAGTESRTLPVSGELMFFIYEFDLGKVRGSILLETDRIEPHSSPVYYERHCVKQ